MKAICLLTWEHMICLKLERDLYQDNSFRWIPDTKAVPKQQTCALMVMSFFLHVWKTFQDFPLYSGLQWWPVGLRSKLQFQCSFKGLYPSRGIMVLSHLVFLKNNKKIIKMYILFNHKCTSSCITSSRWKKSRTVSSSSVYFGLKSEGRVKKSHFLLQLQNRMTLPFYLFL